MTVPMEDKVFFDELLIRMTRFSEIFRTIQGLLEVLLGEFDNVIPQNNGTASARLRSAYLAGSLTLHVRSAECPAMRRNWA